MRFLTHIACLGLLALLPLHAAEDAAKVAARRAVLDLAGAFTANDGYKLRDGFFTAMLKTGEAKLLALNLYAGNNYWFCAATPDADVKLEVLVFDETGQPTPVLTYVGDGKSAAGFTPASSGLYYVKVTLLKGKTTPVCFLYTYK